MNREPYAVDVDVNHTTQWQTRLRRHLTTHWGRLLCMIVGAVLLLGAADTDVLHAQSESIRVYAEVEPESVALGDPVTLSVKVIGTEPTRPLVDQLDGFEIVSTSSGTQISINNGGVDLQFTYRYVLMPERAGELQIDAIPVLAGNQTHYTEPVTVFVSQGSAAPQPTVTPQPTATTQPTVAPQPTATPAQRGSSGAPAPTAVPTATPDGETDRLPSRSPSGDMFVEAEIDNPNPYVGEQVTYTFRFFHAVTTFGQPRYEPPAFSGFWNQQESSEIEYMLQSGGNFYDVTELKTVLFPTVAGERTIEPATISVKGSLLNAGASLQTEPISITVKPHPAPTPETFGGAVGQLNIAAEIDTTQTAVNEPVMLRITLEGAGNVDTWPAPTLPDLADWRIFDDSSEVVTQMQEERLVGRRVYEYMLVPTSEGDFTVPSIESGP